MQEAPNFNSYRSRFSGADRATVLDSREVISGSDRDFLESVYARLLLYFDDEDFRSRIPLQTRTHVEDNFITNIIAYLENIANWQRDGSTQIVGPNLQGQIQNISGQVVNLDQQIAGYYFTYLFSSEPLGEHVQAIKSLASSAEQERQTLHEVVENVKAQVNDRKQSYDKQLGELEAQASQSLTQKVDNGGEVLANIETILKQAQLLVGRASGHQLGDYYHKLANGRTILENDEYTKKRGKGVERYLNRFKPKKAVIVTALSSLIVYAAIMYLIYQPLKLASWFIILLVVFCAAATLLLVAAIFVKGVMLFNLRYKGGHERTSVLWMIGAIVSTLFTAVYASILIHELTSNGRITWEEIIPKIIVLLAPAYLVRLCIQNYRANAHLMVQYMHRATIMSIAENYSHATSVDASQKDNVELIRISHEAKMMILTDAAKIMFAQSESGYITQKEGAGTNGDNMIDSLRSGIK